MSYQRGSMKRYESYEGCYRASCASEVVQKSDSDLLDSKKPAAQLLASSKTPSSRQQHMSNGLHDPNGHSNPNSRLEYIINSMAYIRGELDDLKESDRVLLEIFKQLENDVAELNDNISTWRLSGSFSQGRPVSITDLDFSSSSRSSYCDHLDSTPSLNTHESVSNSSKDDGSCKASHETDSLLLPEHDNSSSSYSPILQPFRPHAGSSAASGSGGSTRSKKAAHPSPHMKTSVSFSNSPGISRLQDETSSNISRNSSIDSGIQFASEAENGSANSVDVVQPSTRTTAVAEDTEDVRKSVGFADDIFAALGLGK